ncbi:MAG: hypothetical protein P8Z42_00880 [Anaerolineales bacterium]|jgi:hypothetical protein
MKCNKAVVYILFFICLGGMFSFATMDEVSAKITDSSDAAQGVQSTPNLSFEERLSRAIPRTNVDRKDLDRLVYGNQLDWPEMRYLNEGVTLLGRTVTPIDFQIFPGGDTVSVYSPRDGQLYTDALWYITEVLENGQRAFDAVMIPPGGSLVMVQIEIEPPISNPDETCGSSYEGPRGDSFRIAYPGLGEHAVAYTPLYPYSGGYKLQEYAAPFVDCPDDGWLYFYIPTLEADPANIWLEFVQSTAWYDERTGEPIVGTKLAFWTLTERP